MDAEQMDPVKKTDRTSESLGSSGKINTDEFQEQIHVDHQQINDLLVLPHDSYSLTKIRFELPSCMKYGVRSGTGHSKTSKFSDLSKGKQEGAIAVAAFAATRVQKPSCWSTAVIDQILDDGDKLYCESHKNTNTEEHKSLSIMDLNNEFCIQKKFHAKVSIGEPVYVGRYRSEKVQELHLVKALNLFFQRHCAGILVSSVLNCAIWKEGKYFNMFDGRARKENGEPAKRDEQGTAKLFLLRNLNGIFFMILQKSRVKNQTFMIHSIEIIGVDPGTSLANDRVELAKPSRRPSGYQVIFDKVWPGRLLLIVVFSR